MINFHPNDQDLARFCAGHAPSALALMISAHVDMCARCQAQCAEIQEQISVEALSHSGPLDEQFSAMMSSITALPVAHAEEGVEQNTMISLDGKSFTLPRALQRYVKDTGNWSHLVGKLWQAPVELGAAGKAHFIYMEKGGRVPEHTHKGKELTLVIDGQFSDGISDYDTGDFTVMDDQHKHMPHSEADDGCLVFSIVDQPLHFTAGITRLLNPFSHLFFK
jgi:putative transcriptional regulator